ncbi:MAG: SDR family NAD(P)-dependent oxidoreductase, partial [Verrucomicrobia bacterium]|nr:SDR family NAD(P)-dependent oxidoreductase [Verrucomicrobiota bacterium]
YKARLVLSGRTPLDQGIASFISELERLGGKASYVIGDISTPGAAEALVRAAVEAHGRIDGILHAAGVVRGGRCDEVNQEAARATWSAKIEGALALDLATRDLDLDWIVLFSSVSSLIGLSEAPGYAEGNGFLDAFAEWREEERRQGRRRGKTIALNWPRWREGGMRVLDEAAAQRWEQWARSTQGFAPLEAEAGLRAFLRAVESPGGSVIIAQGDASKIEKTLRRGLGLEHTIEPDAAAATGGGSDAATSATGPQAVEVSLKSMVRELLKLPPEEITREGSLSEFGFDSITLKAFADRLNARYGLNLMPSVFFTYPNLASLQAHLLEAFPEALNRAGSVPDSGPVQPAVGRQARPVLAASSGARAADGEPIAVVGMSGVFPGASNVDEFWENLRTGRDCVSEIPPERWDWREIFGDAENDSSKSDSKWGGFIRDFDKFDAAFFNLSRREVELMDPQHRLFLQEAWHAVEAAGENPRDLSGRNVGVFAGVQFNEYQNLLAVRGLSHAYGATGNAHAMIANRVSYLLNLTGASESIDTACSSSLVALHRALLLLQRQECDAALAGGVSLMLNPGAFVGTSQMGVLSPDGRCKTFDASANGYVKGEGVGVVYLKRLSDAQRDGNPILAVIKSALVNHGGRAQSLTSPNVQAQRDLLVQAYRKAGVDLCQVGYIEVHGTGTELGDPVEVDGLQKAFAILGVSDQEARCGLGSVKTNIGHLEPAAGIAGVIKVLLALRQKTLPATLHLQRLNPYIQLGAGPFYIVESTRDWAAPRDREGRTLPRVAGVSSFGFGGTNAHVVLEEYSTPANLERAEPEQSVWLCALSAKSRDGLLRRVADLRRWLAHEGAGATLGDISFSLNVGRGHYAHRCAILAGSCGELSRLLDVAAAGGEAEGLVWSKGDRPSHEPALTLALSQREREQPATLPKSLDVVSAIAVRGDGLPGRQNQAPDGDPFSLAHPMGEGRGEGPSQSVDREQVRMEKGPSQEPDPSLVARLAALQRELAGPAAATMVNRSGLVELAQLYCQRLTPDWAALYARHSARRLALPGYPFAPTRYWVPDAPQAAAALPTSPALHPLLDANSSTFQEQSFAKRLTAADDCLRDHVVGGVAMLPGAAYLEMARAAAEWSQTRAPVHSITGVAWSQPIQLVGEARHVDVVLRPTRDGAEYEVRSSTAGTSILHNRGHVHFGRPAEDVPPVSILDILARLTTKLDRDTIYEFFATLGLQYGPSFQTLEWAAAGEGEVLGKLKLPEALRADASRFVLHPSLLDGAFQTIVAIGLGAPTEEKRSAILPFALDSISWRRSLPASCFVHVRRCGGPSVNGLHRYDLTILDEQGARVCLIKGLTLKTANPRSAGSGSVRYLEPAWEAARTSGGPDAWPSAVMVLDSGGGSSGELEQEWPRIDAASGSMLVKVTAGREFAQVGERHFQVRPGAEEDGARVRAALREMHVSPSLLINLCPLRCDGWPSQWEERVRTDLLAEFTLIKSWLAGDGGPLRVLHLCRDEMGGWVAGFAKSLIQEHPACSYHLVHLEPGSAVPMLRTALSAVTDFAGQQGFSEFRHTAEGWQVRQLREAGPAEDTNSALRNGGVYLISGGAGGLGRIVARHLATVYRAKLVLMGRSSPRPEIEAFVATLRESGGDAAYVQGDITLMADVERAVREGEARFGAVHGVIHAAGVLRDARLVQTDPGDVMAVLGPKIAGALNLDKATRQHALDCFVLFSSASAEFGNPGQSAYAAANSFLDRWAVVREAMRAAGDRRGRTVSVNWPLWREGGMRMPSAVEAWLRVTYRSVPLERAVGLEALEHVLRRSVPQTIVVSEQTERPRSVEPVR